ncbi:amino acid permease [Candidatus Bathyarchaeota archaeon]|nr:amino acid permease [Candidatus Bathyarchaeota archaeon]
MMSFAGIAAGSSALSTSISVQSSIAQGMSRDGYLPRTLLSKHPRFGTPYVALIVGALFMVLFSSTGVVAFLAYAGSFSSLLVFAFVNLSLLKLRNEKPHMDRRFKTPLYPLTPISGFITSIVLLVFPLYLGDVHAVDALVSGLGVTALALITYYLRMLGLCRVRIAVGGISLAVGALLTLLASLAEADIVSSILPYFPSYVVLLISLFFIISGILNVFQSDPD